MWWGSRFGQFQRHSERYVHHRRVPKISENSHLNVDYLVSMPTLGSMMAAQGDTTRPLETARGWYDFYTYVRLRPNTDLAAFAAKLPAFTDKYIDSHPGTSKADIRNVTTLQPLTDIHLWSGT